MNDHDEFRPDLTNTTDDVVAASLRTRVQHVKAGELSSATAQTVGMQRLAALTGASVGSAKIWMGGTHVSPLTVSDNHHHGESETAIFVRSGYPEFVFHDGREEVRVATAPGDYVFVPPHVPHREENPDPDHPAVIVIARSTQEAIVVNLAELYALSDTPTEHTEVAK
ncbi:cupin domain-containing protein [Mycolicibacterium moriokaense]|uniref:Putative RmlC-like cupin family protein n=1 Tax=Mycolicibacterium moriokaense TaxID=39691 RepID=A0A318H7P8_9MYCO|nr:cupin domain-containing protein [Mycolicibacterium moriokaense]PXX00758.1 putative RmlC-like cupin family protein [Mycolicibacterium moriokaense]